MATSTTPSSSNPFYTDFVPARNRKKRKSKFPASLREKEPLSVDTIYRLRDELARGDDDWLPQCQRPSVPSVPPALSRASTYHKSANLTHVSFAGHAVPEEVLCLGLGSPSASSNARMQLTFLLAICQHLNIGFENVSLYDPVFTADDCALFGALHMNVLTENKASVNLLPSIFFSLRRMLSPFRVAHIIPTNDGGVILMPDFPERVLRTYSADALFHAPLRHGTVREHHQSQLDPAAHSVSNTQVGNKGAVPFSSRLWAEFGDTKLSLWPTAFNNIAVQVLGRLQTDDLDLPEGDD
ncbi:hypothetical protein C0995_006944 [Termitomyces sp. Mi166|nr:hypothetical protein C0995_006944 [Termitomyces sp. Mi166\